MIVIHDPAEISPAMSGACVTIGNFDGVHVGHQTLIHSMIGLAGQRGLESVVVTFDPHPLRVLKGARSLPNITLLDHKLELMAGLGVELCLVLPFTRQMAALEPEAFVEHYLVQGLRLRSLVIGYDYAFGKNRKGNYALLRSLGEAWGFRVEQLDPVIVDGAVVSSTRIRDLIQSGDVWNARPLLGRFYQVRGEVIHGHDRGGKLLGCPTANLKLVDELFPKGGVYAVWAECPEIGLEAAPAVANIGYNPTFGDDALSVEVHLLDFAADLYGRKLHVHFVQRIRSEQKFDGLESLMARIRQDIVLGREILALPQAAL